MALLSSLRYTRSERRAVGLLVGLILLVNMGTLLVRVIAVPESIPLNPESSPISELDTRGKSAEHLALLELNSADSTDLLSLYGIGPVYSARIIKYRNLLGGYYSPKQLLEVYGMDSVRYLGFHKKVTSDPLLIDQINLVTVGFKELLRHPYVQYDMVKTFIHFRDVHGPPDDFTELWEEASWPDSLRVCLLPYLSLGNE